VIPTAILLVIVSTALPVAQEPIRDRSDGGCSKQEQLIQLYEGVAVYARCETVASGQIMHAAVENGSAEPVTGFGIGFCEDAVVEVAAGQDWQAAKGSDHGVQFTVRDEAALAAGKRLDGFTVTLRRPRMLTQDVSVQWIDVLGGKVATHDCPF